MSAILADFDGTIVTRDLAEIVLSKFASPDWRRFNDLLLDGEISVEDCVSREYAMIDARSPADILRFARKYYHPRAGFVELLGVCEREKVEFAVVSAGLDFCIEDFFRALGPSIPRLVCPKSSFVPHRGIHLTFPGKHLPSSRDFKEDAVAAYQSKGYDVIYVGDGAGDLHAAEKADFVFTIRSSALETMCNKMKISNRAIVSFDPVVQFLSH